MSDHFFTADVPPTWHDLADVLADLTAMNRVIEWAKREHHAGLQEAAMNGRLDLAEVIATFLTRLT